MTREQIVDILSKHWNYDEYNVTFKSIADAILALFEQKESKSMTESLIREIAADVWNNAVNSYRMYPNNKHTFAEFWNRSRDLFIELYAQQPQKVEQEEEKPTDEEIEKWASNISTELAPRVLLIMAAKAMRDNPKQFKSNG